MQPLSVAKEIARVVLVEVVPELGGSFVVGEFVGVGYGRCALFGKGGVDEVLLVIGRRDVVPRATRPDVRVVCQETGG